jgi:hypothetical protein
VSADAAVCARASEGNPNTRRESEAINNLIVRHDMRFSTPVEQGHAKAPCVAADFWPPFRFTYRRMRRRYEVVSA